ncbi:MAG TPA: thiolase family protein [Acidimicrobiales bacterium]|nr:thiolase family protein [Acidimicrobiales bacterium]
MGRHSVSRPKVAIVGVGATAQGRQPGYSANELAVLAAKNALADAGLTKDDIDGLVTGKTYTGPAGRDTDIGQLLGLNARFSQSLTYGSCNFSLHTACMAIEAGLAETILLTYATNAGTLWSGFPIGLNESETHSELLPVPAWAALMFRRHQHLYGATEADLGAVTVAQRRWAALNPQAVRRELLTMDDYLASPYLFEPIRKLDICPYDDGGVSLIMTTADRAADLHHPPVVILGQSELAELRVLQNTDNMERAWMTDMADASFADAGISRSDIDIVSIQEPGSIWVLQLLEALGFVGPGEAGAFILEGHTSPGGQLPVNTGGGHLAESYMWGWLHLVEITRQLRGEAGGRQVPSARTAIHCSTLLSTKGASTIFGVDV